MSEKLNDIKMIVMDVDGTLTDGKIYLGNNGEEFKAFDVHDGYILAKCQEYWYITAIITGKNSKIVEKRASDLRINEVYQGVTDKISVLKSLADKYNLSNSNIAYIGDDLNDMDCINYVAFSGCPADSIDEVKKSVNYVCKHNGGKGAVREFVDYLIFYLI